MALTASSTQSHGSWCVQGRTVWREPVRNKPLGSALTRLFCIYRELQLKLWTPTQNKTNEEMSRAPRSVGVSRSDSRKKKKFSLLNLFSSCPVAFFFWMHARPTFRNFQHFAKKIILKCLLSESGRAEWENIWPRSSTHGPHCCRFVRHDFEPKTSLAGRPTQSIRAYYLLTQLMQFQARWNL